MWYLQELKCKGKEGIRVGLTSLIITLCDPFEKFRTPNPADLCFEGLQVMFPRWNEVCVGEVYTYGYNQNFCFPSTITVIL